MSLPASGCGPAHCCPHSFPKTVRLWPARVPQESATKQAGLSAEGVLLPRAVPQRQEECGARCYCGRVGGAAAPWPLWQHARVPVARVPDSELHRCHAGLARPVRPRIQVWGWEAGRLGGWGGEGSRTAVITAACLRLRRRCVLALLSSAALTTLPVRSAFLRCLSPPRSTLSTPLLTCPAHSSSP